MRKRTTKSPREMELERKSSSRQAKLGRKIRPNKTKKDYV